MLLSDFISVLSFAEKHNGEHVSSYETFDFCQCCLDLGLQDVNYTGCHYSWTNGTVWRKLDRVMTNPYWSSLQRLTHFHFDPPEAFTDHSPAKVSLDHPVQGRRNFKFFNMWASHDQFLDVVSTHWSSDLYGTPMYLLCHRLKILKRPLKELNRLHFSHISERVSRLETELADHQLSLHHDRDNHRLLDQEKLLRSKLSQLKFVERKKFSQKIKCNFLKESDRGTKFFHALMNHNHRRNFIPAIMIAYGCQSSSLEEVHSVFVNYFQQQLGTSNPTIPLDSEVIHSGPCLSSNSHALLLSPVTHDDI